MHPPGLESTKLWDGIAMKTDMGETIPVGSAPTLSPKRGAPTNVPSWRSRFVLSAKAQAPRKMELVGDSACDALAADLVRRASLALDAGVSPTLVDDGLGGTYFIRDEHGDELSVFKPRDEEPTAINNPKNEGRSGLGEAGLKGGIRIGDAAFNEAAAYLLDARSGHFSRVPPTAIARSEHSAFFDVSSGEGNSYDEAVHSPFRSLKTKVGSLQRFVSHDGCADDFSASIFSELEVQRIACLDVRLFNTDRHSANLLVQRTPRPETPTPRGVSPSPPDSSPPDSSPPRSPARSASPSSPLVRSPEARPTSPSPLGATPPTSIVPPVSCSLQYDAQAHSEVMRVDVALPPMLPVPFLGGAVALNRGARSVSTLPPSLQSVPATLQTRTEVEDGAAGEYPRLIPIDHGFCLPAAITVPYFEWQHWPQADAPLHPKVMEHVCSMDVEADVALLSRLTPTAPTGPAIAPLLGISGGSHGRSQSSSHTSGSSGSNGSNGSSYHANSRANSTANNAGSIRTEASTREPAGLRAASLTTFRVGSLVLQTAALAHCTLRQIAELMCDPDPLAMSDHKNWPLRDTLLPAYLEGVEGVEGVDAGGTDADAGISCMDSGHLSSSSSLDDTGIAPRAARPIAPRASGWGLVHAPCEQMSPVSVLSSCGVTSGAAAGAVSSWAISEPESDEPPTRLQLLCHAARVEALQKGYETTKALQPAARHAAEEAAFLEILRRRLTEHFNSVASAAAPPRKA